MPSSYTSSLRLIEMATGEDSGTWGSNLNTGMIALVDTAVAGIQAISTTGGTTTLTANDGTADQSRAAILNVTGALVSNAIIVAPSGVSKTYIIANNTTGAYTVTMSAGGTTLAITQGEIFYCYTDGTNFYAIGNNAGLQGTAAGNINMNNFVFSNASMKSYYETYNAMGSVASTGNLDYSLANYQSITLTGNVTLTPTNWPSTGNGASMTLFVTQDATGSRTLTFSSGTIKVPGGGGLVLSTTPNAVDEVLITTFNGGTTWYVAVLKSFS